MKNSGKNKIKRFITDNYKLLILFIGLTLLNIFFLCWSFKANDLTFGKTFIFMLIGSIILELILCVIIFIAQKKTWKIEKIFLILSLIIGVFYVFALPVGRAPDEESHFFRIYEITTGHVVSSTAEDNHTRGSIEASNIEIVRDFKENNVKYIDVANALTIYPDNNEESFVKTSASSYNPLVYTPHLIGMGLGEALHLPLLITAYLAKLFNCVVCILILYFCIKYIPILKEFVFLISFFPITMQAMTSLSADGFITVISIAFISFILYASYSMTKPFTKKHLAIIFLLCLILSLSKVVYALVCLLLLAVPKERFGNSKRKIITIISIGCICSIALLSWLLISSALTSTADPTNHDILFNNPFLYLFILLKSISVNFHLYFTGILGGYLEWFNVVLSPLYLFPTAIIFVLLCKKARDSFTINKTLRILSIIIFIAITILTFTAMYTSWTKPGETTIDGVQGRYFLPILLLIPLAFISNKKTTSKKIPSPQLATHLKQNYYLYGFLIFESVYAITSIACSHL